MTFRPYVRKAHFYETDQMGIIHHSNYIRWFEESRVDFMEQMGYGYRRASEAGIDFALLSVSCGYRSMVRFGDTVYIHPRLASFSGTRMTVSYEILDEAGTVRTVGETKHCFYSSRLGRPVSIKKQLPALYDLFLSVVAGQNAQSK